MIAPTPRRHPRRPRLGFLGVGWIGLHRLKTIAESGLAEIAAVADPAEAAARAATDLAPAGRVCGSLEHLLELDLDGVVIATPSAAHASQAIRALEAGLAVFCQKPLGRDAAETSAVVAAARAADRLLAVDLSYRFTEPMRRIHALIREGELGHVFAASLVFHNAYGPDKPWFLDPTLSGGGCLMDLGIHLIDLALWSLDFPEVRAVSSQLLAGGLPLSDRAAQVEDYAAAQLVLDTGAVVQLACSWRLPAGREAIIEAAFHGTRGGAALRNVGGSFYDFIGERYRGTATEPLASPPDAWGGRAAVDWVRRLSEGARFDPGSERLVTVAQTLDRLYQP